MFFVCEKEWKRVSGTHPQKQRQREQDKKRVRESERERERARQKEGQRESESERGKSECSNFKEKPRRISKGSASVGGLLKEGHRLTNEAD